jgi:hypothetical protein
MKWGFIMFKYKGVVIGATLKGLKVGKTCHIGKPLGESLKVRAFPKQNKGLKTKPNLNLVSMSPTHGVNSSIIKHERKVITNPNIFKL